MPLKFPPSGRYLRAIRESSRELRTRAGIKIAPSDIERLLRSPAFIESFQCVSNYHGLSLPLKFASNLDELNLLSILCLLNFGSGFRAPLHTQTGRGAWDSIRALAFSIYLTSATGQNDLLSAKGLITIDVAKIAELMGFNIYVETQHPAHPAISVGELGGPLYDLVKRITSVLNETGEILHSSGYANLGSFVAEALQHSQKASGNEAIEIILERIVRAFPGFQDMSEVEGKPVYCFKKALFLIHAIYIRFGSISPLPFPVPSTVDLPIFSDNVIPSLLIHLGVIDLSTAPSFSGLFPDAGSAGKLNELLGSASSLPQKDQQPVAVKAGSVLTSQQSYILRAAAIDACELILETAVRQFKESNDETVNWISKIKSVELDMWIWGVAKDRIDYRALERFVDQDTIYF